MLDDRDEFVAGLGQALQNIAADYEISIRCLADIIDETRERMAPFLHRFAEQHDAETGQRVLQEFDVIMLERGLKRRDRV